MGIVMGWAASWRLSGRVRDNRERNVVGSIVGELERTGRGIGRAASWRPAGV